MGIRANLMTALALALALGCGTAPGRAGDSPSPAPESPSPVGGTTVGTHEGAVVRVELRGIDNLVFRGGARIILERFVVNLGGVSLLRDLADPAGAKLDLSGRRLPVLGPPGETTVDRFIIGVDSLQGAAFKGIKLELSPPSQPSSGPDDGAGSTIFFQAVYSMPTSLDIKGDQAKISPNPAPIEPTGSFAQALTSSFRLPFSFKSRKAEDLLVGLGGEALAAGRTLIVVFSANRWFTEEVQSFLTSESTARMRLGISGSTPLALVGEGFTPANESEGEIARVLESNILDSIGVEIR